MIFIKDFYHFLMFYSFRLGISNVYYKYNIVDFN